MSSHFLILRISLTKLFFVFSEFGNLAFKMSDTDNSATLELIPKLFPLDRDIFYHRDGIKWQSLGGTRLNRKVGINLRRKSSEDMSPENAIKIFKSPAICDSNEGKCFFAKK